MESFFHNNSKTWKFQVLFLLKLFSGVNSHITLRQHKRFNTKKIIWAFEIQIAIIKWNRRISCMRLMTGFQKSFMSKSNIMPIFVFYDVFYDIFYFGVPYPTYGKSNNFLRNELFFGVPIQHGTVRYGTLKVRFVKKSMRVLYHVNWGFTVFIIFQPMRGTEQKIQFIEKLKDLKKFSLFSWKIMLQKNRENSSYIETAIESNFEWIDYD